MSSLLTLSALGGGGASYGIPFVAGFSFIEDVEGQVGIGPDGITLAGYNATQIEVSIFGISVDIEGTDTGHGLNGTNYSVALEVGAELAAAAATSCNGSGCAVSSSSCSISACLRASDARVGLDRALRAWRRRCAVKRWR